MPYIKPIERAALAGNDNFDRVRPMNPGELNYVITRFVHQYIKDRGGPCYAEYNAAVGVLECAKLELYRRHVAPYEDQKITENGDVP